MIHRYLCTLAVVLALVFAIVKLDRIATAGERIAGESAELRRVIAAKDSTIARQDRFFSTYYHTAEATIKDLQAQVDKAKRRKHKQGGGGWGAKATKNVG